MRLGEINDPYSPLEGWACGNRCISARAGLYSELLFLAASTQILVSPDYAG